ncbi:MAG: hypothetical protein A2X31_04740 [Elusimicrobia bacterium GWB2_63_22]|nr:MAG: hypothetical protein A2X31_04740 [Elusimicrobia bacterium GWB2_63_22]
MKYWAYVNNEILGPFEKDKLLELPSFSPSLLVCPQTPVGEKTEDWKETSTYPELAALIGAGAGKASAPAPDPQPAPAPAQESAPPRDVVEPGPAITTFKPLKAASIEPMAPAEHKLGGVEIAVNRLGKAGGEAAPAAAQPAPSAFDPISLSTIVRRTENMSGQDAAADGIAKEPPKAFGDLSPDAAGSAGLEISAITRENAAPAPAPSEDFTPQRFGEPAPAAAAPAPQPEPASAPQPEAYQSGAQEQAAQPAAASAPVTDTAGLATLLQRLDYMAKSAVNRQDINAAVEPLRSKLDQMGEVISAIKNSQFQREVMDKLSYLENSVAEMKAAVKNIQAAPAPAQPAPQPTVSMEKASDVFMGVQSPPKAAPKPEPVKEEAKPAEIVDQGSKPSRLVPALKKAAKALVTVVLLIAVALGAVIGLKNFGIFDATKFIPFQLPFVAADAQPGGEQPADGQAAADAIAAMAAAEQQIAQAEAGQAAPAQPQEQPQPAAAPERAPEVIYFTRTFKLKADGPTLEDKISEHAARSGGDYNRADWQVKQAVPGVFEIAGVVPAKDANLTYTFTVNLEGKTLQPGDDYGKTAYAALAAAAPKPRAPRQRAGKAAAKPQPKKAAPKKLAPPPAEEEYEYVYEDEDGTAQ